jgi:hypothetical protein
VLGEHAKLGESASLAIPGDRDDSDGAKSVQLLAMHDVRRGLERLAAGETR